MPFSFFIFLCFWGSLSISALVQLPANLVIPPQAVTLSNTTSDPSPPSNQSTSANGTSARGLNRWPPVYPGMPYIYRLDPPDPSGVEYLAFTRYGRTGGPRTFDLLLTLLLKAIREANFWPPGSYLDDEVSYRLPEAHMILTARGHKPLEQGYEALTADRFIAVMEALRSLVSAYGAREFSMVASRGRGWTKKKFGIFKLEGPFPDSPSEAFG